MTSDITQRRHDAQELHQRLDSILEELQSHADRLAAVQGAMLQKDLPSLPGFEAAVVYQPRQVVGGDWYGVVPFPAESDKTGASVAIAVGDVCGHDVAATVVMAMVLTILRCYPHYPSTPADIMRHLNARLCEFAIPYGFTTAFVGFLSLDTLKFTYCSAGHPPALVRHPDGSTRLLDRAHGLPLGMFEDAQCVEAEETLAPGSLLCLYTDGWTETASPEGALYGAESLRQALVASGSGLASLDSIVAELARHQASAPQADDRTLLLAKIRTPNSGGNA